MLISCGGTEELLKFELTLTQMALGGKDHEKD